MYGVKLNEPNVLPCVEAIRVLEGSDVVGKVNEARTSGTEETGRQERVRRDPESQGRRAERVLCFDAFLQCSFPQFRAKCWGGRSEYELRPFYEPQHNSDRRD
jgi:hypothetical protein